LEIFDELTKQPKLYTEEEVKKLLEEQQRRFKLVHRVIWLTKPLQLSLRIERIDITEDGQVVYVR
jgi:hypothetical protein